MNGLIEPSLKPQRFSKRKETPLARATARRVPDAGWRSRFHLTPHRLRRTVQIAFLCISILIGLRFVLFYLSCVNSWHSVVSRPPGVEAFLPISALVSARYWLHTGIIHPVHPAGLLIFGAILAISFLFKKSFCSWVCPFGFVSEKLADAGRKVIGRNFFLPKFIDWPMRALKYLLLGFFVWMIFFRMDVAALRAFLDSRFNETADVRLLQFFLHPGHVTIVVLAVLIGLSLLVRHFWCRYLCPYGALTALFGLASPTRIRRNIPSCIECGKCARACPAALPVNRLLTVHSDECSLCLECVQACPVTNTLGVENIFPRRRIKPLVIALAIVGIFLLVVVVGRLTGHWQSSIYGAN